MLMNAAQTIPYFAHAQHIISQGLSRKRNLHLTFQQSPCFLLSLEQSSKAKIIHTDKVKTCSVHIKGPHHRRVTVQLTAQPERPERRNQIFSKSKRKTLPKQILESRRNNCS